MTFDLKAAREELGDINDPNFCDCDIRRILSAALDEIERLQDALVEERAKTIYYNPDEETGRGPSFGLGELASDAADLIRERAEKQLRAEGLL